MNTVQARIVPATMNEFLHDWYIRKFLGTADACEAAHVHAYPLHEGADESGQQRENWREVRK